MKTFSYLPLVILTLAGCSPTETPSAVQARNAPPVPTSTSTSALSTKIFNEVNDYRTAKGRKPLVRHAGLDQLALQHSEDMRRTRGGKTPKGIVNHQGFSSRFAVVQAKYRMDSMHENAAVAPRGFSIVQTWINSKGHESAMRTNWSYTGVGAVVDSDGTVFATQLFGNISLSPSLQNRRSTF